MNGRVLPNGHGVTLGHDIQNKTGNIRNAVRKSSLYRSLYY